jgi:dihydrodipicolinate synthase/N-acetylneuraminate lyase
MADLALGVADLADSVIAEPPMAWSADRTLNLKVNLALAEHMRAGGVRTVLYGGNANLSAFTLGQFEQAVELMGIVAQNSRVIAAIGPELGRMLDQAGAVERSGLRNVLLLPVHHPADTHGTGDGVREIASRLGFGVIVDLCRENYLRPVTLAKLRDEGAVRLVRYSVRRDNPEDDSYLDRVIEVMGREQVFSGLGEAAALDHVGKRAMLTYASGAATIAPAAAMRLHASLRRGDLATARQLIRPFVEFARLGDMLGPIQVVHDGADMLGLGAMGPPLPMLSRVKTKFRDDLEAAVTALLKA